MNSDNAKTGELMPDEKFPKKLYAAWVGGRMSTMAFTSVAPEYESQEYTRAPKSPPVQSDAELQGAIAWMREKHKAGELPHGATWYLNKIIEAAEQRVAGQAEAIEALKEARKTLSSIGGYMLIGASDEATVCNRDHVIPALALLTAQKGV